LSKDVLARCLAIDLDNTNQIIAESNKEDDYDAIKAEDIQRQYQEKWYIEYEVADNDDKEKDNPVDPPTSAPSQVYPAPGRRRCRLGLQRSLEQQRGSIE
jgi:hypothetical protein